MAHPGIEIRLLGSPSVSDGEGNLLQGLGPGKPLGMLAYLLVKGESRREELVNLFWGELPEQKARNAFRQTLHRLRGAIGEEHIPVSTSTIALSSGTGIWSDITAFESALRHGEIDKALALRRGPFLDGLELGESEFERWVLAERTRLDARYQGALAQAVNAASLRGDINEAAAKAELLSKAAPFSSEAAISEATVLVAAGRTTEARSTLERFSERYRQEIGDVPAAVREMLSHLRKSSLGASEPRLGGALDAIFVGREKELGQLLAIWNETRAGRGAAVSISGGEGIGKSALVDEFAARAANLGALLTISGREPSSGSMVPYASIGRALRGVLNAPGLSGASQHLLAEAARLVPELRDQFELPAIEPLNDDAALLRFYEGVAALLDAVAYEQPVLVILEDFHNAAVATAQLLEYLSDRLAGVSIMFCVLHRTGAVSIRERGVERIELGPLSQAETAALIGSVTDDDVLPEDERNRIAALSGGIPYRALELARQAAGGLNPSALPATVKDVLLARLQGCSPAQQRLFVASALLERPASIRLLAAASHLSETAALDAVMALEGLGLVKQSHSGVKPSHDEAAGLALEGTGPAGRALLAGWAAEAITQEPGASKAELAHLFNIAGNRIATFENSIAAAYEAAALGSTESLNHFVGLARQTASTTEERRELETLSQLFEGGVRRLGSGKYADLLDAAESFAEDAEGGVLATRTTPALVHRVSMAFAASRTMQLLGVLVVVSVIGSIVLVRETRQTLAGPLLPDTLFLSNRSSGNRLFYLTGQQTSGVSLPREYSARKNPTWVDSVSLPFMNPRVSPSGAYVAVERMREGGPDILLYNARGTGSRVLVAGPGDDIISGWSPDSQWLLATYGASLANGNYDADLYAIQIGQSKRVPIDTADARSVVEAAWSPDGTHIAWTARVGATHQQEVFMSNGDGSNLVRVSNSQAEDYRLVWSPSGDRIAFTTDRFGNADIMAYEIATRELWRLTWDPAHDDHAVFSPDGNFVAFESTRGGIASVFVTRSFAGSPARVSGSDQAFSISHWGTAKSGSSYVAGLRIRVQPRVGVGQTANATIEAFDLSGQSISQPHVTWKSLDPQLLAVRRVVPLDSGETNPLAQVSGLRPGLARIAVSAGGWRTDTALVLIGSEQLTLLHDDFGLGLNADNWQPVGDPLPRIILASSGTALSPNSSRQGESGVLGRQDLPLQPVFSARVIVRAPLHGPTASRSFMIGLIAVDSAVSGTPNVPRFQKLAFIEWVGQAARIAYGVDREIWTEPAAALGTADAHTFEIRIDSSSRVSFYSDGKLRWKSSLRAGPDGMRARLWLSSRGAGNAVLFEDARISLGQDVAQAAR